MADGKKEEKRSIRDSTKSLKKYGSTCNHFKRQDHFVKHTVVEGETLQGIALKYGVTMEQIRRVNRLWASDSLFLRESLMIPVSRPDVSVTLSDDLVFDDAEDMHSPSSISDSEERSIRDFLVKIDTSIANTKSQVKKSVGNSFWMTVMPHTPAERSRFPGFANSSQHPIRMIF
ncbi:lysM and putative peptidoglycan-binding domain-containing protein 2 isoform X2 [Cryptotermes secundus]|uniref:lysM and putative peptidoglycan-binding domain-containing protein 2 isoform X2 n=1 Tax=Cryptotermes secundus TaxID=105785 RepID=UPI000CD7C66C|nr:lysM and putative peptidoglycan-binding domain-containing protein 2 isoform X2 [Cryptotermes secundus]